MPPSTFEIVGVANDMRYMTYDYKDPSGPCSGYPKRKPSTTTTRQFNAFDLYSHFLNNIVIWAPGNPPGDQDKCAKRSPISIPIWSLYGVESRTTRLCRGDFQQENMIAT